MVPGFLKSPGQELWFYKAALNAPSDAVILEIGCFKGRSSVSFGFGCIGTRRHVYSVDLFEGDGSMYGKGEFLSDFERNVQVCGLTDYITPIKQYSTVVARSWDRQIDILFIDGSHNYDDVKADFEAFYPFVKKGGIVALHDVRGMWKGVIKLWSEIRKDGLLINCGEVSSLGYGQKP